MLCIAWAALAAAISVADDRGRPHVWTQSTFADFAAGRFGDAGANTYVSAAGRVQLVNRWDLNHDGFIDLVFCNSHPHVEKLDAALYWGNGQDLSEARVSPVPNAGAQWTVAADLDRDGRLDAVMPSYTNGTWSRMDSCVYYGAAEPAPGPSSRQPFGRKVALPTIAAQKAAVGDLNRDGWPDIAFAQSAGFWEYRGGSGAGALASPSRIFWGSPAGFGRDRLTDIEAAGASDVAIGDLDDDGWPDLVLANRERDGRFAIDSFLYWGSREGFSSQRRTELPTHQANAVALADVDRDGAQDLLFANGEGPVSTVYLNQRGRFSPDRRIQLPTSDARGVATGDLDGDGWVDVFFTNHQTAGNPLTLSYLYRGGPHGFSVERRDGLETVGAWGVSIGDLNEDGRTDLAVSNYREHTSHDVPSYVFWNARGGFSNTRRTSVFTRGAVGNTIADFDGDGHLDVIFNNTIGRTRGGVGPLYVYWGSARGQYSAARRLELPAVEPYEWAAADLNDDGWADLVVANQAEVGRKITESYIYWGGRDGLAEPRRSALVAHGAKGTSVADLDHDGYLDLIFYNAVPDPGLFIYWGGKDGYVTTARTELPSGAGGTAPVADMNGDGQLDLVVPGSPTLAASIYLGDGTRGYAASRRTYIPGSEGASNAEIADFNRDGALDLVLTRRQTAPSHVYYGDARGGFSVDRRTELKTSDCQGVTVGDLNRDGWLDLVCPSYSDTGSRATRSQVYWGSAGGFSDARVLTLPSNAGTGSQIADYNRDGFRDLLLYCHRSEGDPDRAGAFGDHLTDSFLFWGGPDGWRPDRRLGIPGRGTHFDSGVDLGRITDRANEFDYFSPPHHYGPARGDRIDWVAQCPFGTAVRFQIRTSATAAGLEQAPWRGPRGQGSEYNVAGARLFTGPGDEWIQYRARLAGPDGAVSPVLERVSLSFR
jgi:hypothetical protein